MTIISNFDLLIILSLTIAFTLNLNIKNFTVITNLINFTFFNSINILTYPIKHLLIITNIIPIINFIIINYFNGS